MRLAVLSDIHGNSWALEAVLNDAKHRSVDGFINLGDILYGPLKPRETYDLLRSIEATTIRGNQDRAIYEATPADVDRNSTLAYVISDLDKEPAKRLLLMFLPSRRT